MGHHTASAVCFQPNTPLAATGMEQRLSLLELLPLKQLVQTYGCTLCSSCYQLPKLLWTLYMPSSIKIFMCQPQPR